VGVGCCSTFRLSPPSTGHREGTGSRWLGSAWQGPPPPSLPPRPRLCEHDETHGPTSIQIQPTARVGVTPSSSTPLPWSGDHPPEPGRPLRSLVVGSWLGELRTLHLQLCSPCSMVYGSTSSARQSSMCLSSEFIRLARRPC